MLFIFDCTDVGASVSRARITVITNYSFDSLITRCAIRASETRQYYWLAKQRTVSTIFSAYLRGGGELACHTHAHTHTHTRARKSHEPRMHNEISPADEARRQQSSGANASSRFNDYRWLNSNYRPTGIELLYMRGERKPGSFYPSSFEKIRNFTHLCACWFAYRTSAWHPRSVIANKKNVG